MAFSAKILCSLFLCFYSISLQVHAREGLFFSKVSHSSTNSNNVKEAGLSTTEVNVTNQDNEAQPTFTPEVYNAYGLYGHEMDQGANLQEKTSTEAYNGGENSEYMFNNGMPFNSKNKDNNVVYEAKQYGMSDTRYQDNGNNYYNANNYDENKQNSFDGNNNNNYNANNYDENKQNSFNENNNNNYNAGNYGYENKQNSFNGNNNYGYGNKQNSFNANNANYNRYQYPTQQQGMSDTRYLENGKYFYDLNNEELYKNRYQYQTVRRRNDDGFGSSNSRGVNSGNQYSQEGSLDENLSKFNNMEDNQNNQGEYVP